MSQSLCNFFRFFKCVLDPPHGGQSSCTGPAGGKKSFFFILKDKYILFGLKLISASRQVHRCQEIQNWTIYNKVIDERNFAIFGLLVIIVLFGVGCVIFF